MIILGVILLVLGLVLTLHILYVLGIVLLVIGVILALLGTGSYAVLGRRHYY